MDKVITTAFLIIVSVVASVVLFNAFYPAVLESSDAMISMKSRVDERLKSQVEIVHASGELDSGGAWQDVNGDGRFNVFLWAKNIGAVRIAAIERTDVFFGPEGNFARIPHESEAGGNFPYWSWSLENDSDWNPTATLEITIHYSSALSTGRYFGKIVAPSGVADEYLMGL